MARLAVRACCYGRLREVMAEPVSAQERLDKVVVLIAANMVAEVCSVYVLRVDGTLELYATEGLKREAVHETVLKADEGLVGLVASEANPINLSEAHAHPAFSFRPETGEEIYHSFLGVPILRAGNTLGVLTVQNRARRTYTEEEEEALQTTAMVLAEMIASASCPRSPNPAPSRSRATPCTCRAPPCPTASRSATWCCTSRAWWSPMSSPTTCRANSSAWTPPSPPCAPISTAWSSTATVADGGEHRDVLEAYRMFSYDQGWLHKIREAVSTGLTAEAGAERVQSDTRARMLRASAPYLRDRLHDLDDLANRLMRVLMGQDHAPGKEQLPDNAIVVARSMGPAALLDYDRKKTARPDPGGRRADLACLDRGARAGYSDGRRDFQRHRSGRARRRRHRGRLNRPRAYAPAAGHRSSLWRTREAARPAARRNTGRCATALASPRTAARWR